MEIKRFPVKSREKQRSENKIDCSKKTLKSAFKNKLKFNVQILFDMG